MLGLWTEIEIPFEAHHICSGLCPQLSKKKIWECVQPELHTDNECFAMYKDVAFSTKHGVCRCVPSHFEPLQETCSSCMCLQGGKYHKRNHQVRANASLRRDITASCCREPITWLRWDC